MTLIAGFKVNETPILIGDLMITSQPPHEAEKILGKKVVRLSDKCVLAWTGSTSTCNEIFGALYEKFHGEKINFKKMKHHLERVKIKNQGNPRFLLKIIGWIVDTNGSTLFSWNSVSPSIVQQHEEWVSAGTGEEDFTQLYYEFGIQNAASYGFGKSTHDKPYTNALLAIGITWRLMERELTGFTQAYATYGGAYECLYHNGTNFEYLTDITYLYYIHHYDQSNFPPKLWSSVHYPAFKVHSSNKFTTLFTISDVEGKEEKIFHLTGICPPGMDHRLQKEWALFKQKVQKQVDSRALNAKAEFYCIGHRIHDTEGKMIGWYANVEHRSTPENEKTVFETENGIALRVSSEWLERAIDAFSKANRNNDT